MVFESLVVELINRYLGDFVENLDTSQLKIGIWGGDVVLNNLNLKESALDDLDLPVKIKAGHIGKLVLKIPWKNLYTEAVVAEIDGIYALAIPNVGMKYNAEKEEKAKQDAKQKKLAQIEEAKKLEAQKDQPKEEKKDSFAEKLATQVIKNLQVRVSNIHVRYEDRHTNPKRPFSIGVSLQDLLFQTTDENWKPCVIKDAVTQIYKLVKLDCLSVYWNSCSPLLDGLDNEQILDTLKKNVASQGNRPGYHYIVRPISSVAHLRLNTKPDQTNFTIPKIGLTIVFDEIAVGLTKDQYDDVLEMLESMERMNLLSLYRKYRPDLPLPGNSKAWWHYAYNAVLEETVRRRRSMWSWTHIIEHRRMMKRYRETYVKKLNTKKLSSDLQKIIEEGEKFLDVFSITVMRQQAEVESAKLGAQKKEEASKGWFGGWFGGGSKKKEKKDAGGAEDMQKQFYDLYSAEEKAKLYSAIGYQENESDMTLPVEFVAVKVVTKLRNVSVFLRDVKQKEPQILKLQLKDVYSSFGQRPAASAIQLEAKVDKMVVSGTPQNDFVPKMITSQVADKEQIYSLLTVAVETNPLDGQCDTRVKVKARPLEIIYDAQTVNKLADFFKPPESVQLKQFSQAAMAKFDEIKEQSSTGIQFAIEQHKYTDISVDLMSSYVIVPEGGIMKGKGKALVLDLGQLQVSSQKHDVSVHAKESLEEKMQKAYDKFNIKLQRIQLLLAQPDDNWRLARDEGDSPLHILSPISIILDLSKCIFDKDPRMAKMKVSGVLPNINVTVSDARIQDVLGLIQSIPFPESPPPPDEEDELFKGPSDLPTLEPSASVSLSRVVQVAQEDSQASGEKRPELKKMTSVEYVNFIDLELTFEIQEVVVSIRRKEEDTLKPYMRLMVKSIGSNVKMRTFDMLVDAYLGAVFVEHLQYQLGDSVSQQLKSVGGSGGSVVNLVNTPVSTDVDYKLLTVHYLQANKKGPEFATTYQNTEQTLHVTFCALELLLHQGAILSLLEFVQNLTPPAKETDVMTTEPAMPTPTMGAGEKRGSRLTVGAVPSTVSAAGVDKPATPRKRRVKPEDLSVVQMKVTAVLNKFSVGICNDTLLLTQVNINGIEANVSMQKQQMKIGAVLKEMSVLDPDPLTWHHRILCIEGSEVLRADIVVYNEGTEGEKYSDMSCVDTSVDVEIGCIKVVFVNKYINTLLGFVDNFQTAKDKMQEAGQAAAQAGMDAVQSLQETAARLGLKVQMKAPVIIVPQSSKSLNSLMLDLGHLSVINQFQLAGKSSASGVPAVLEEMKVVLTSLQLSRAMMKKEEGVQSECVVLEPLTISVTMHRNLSAAWYHDHPDIQLGGALEPLTVRLSQGDFATAMQVLNENLNEGTQPAAPTTAVATTTGLEASTAVHPNASTVLEPVKEEVPSPKESLMAQDVYTKIKVDFKMKGLIAYFYSGDSVLTEGRVSHEAKSALGKFEIQLIALATSIMSDNAIDARVSLMDMIMDDLRVSKQAGITRMVERSKGGNQQSSNMIAVNFTQNAQQDKNVRLSISSLYVCVCVEFLMRLADFFTKGMEPSDTAVKSPDTTTTPATTATTTAKTEAGTEAGQAAQGTMDIELDMEKPEIILIENQMDLNTNALVVDMMMSFRMLQTPDEQVMDAGIKKLQIFSCTFDRRLQHHTQVLMPCDLSFHSNAKESKKPHMDVSISDIVLNISPATIATMAAVSTGLSPQSGDGDQVKREVIPEHLWAVKRIADCNFWFLDTVKEASEEELKLDLPSPVSSELDTTRGEEGEEQLVVNLPSIVVKLEGGIGRRTLPLLIVESSFQAQVRNWSSQLNVEGSLDLEIGYYNEKLAVWEPLIEPVVADGKTRRWQIGLEVQMNDDSLPPPEETSVEAEDQVVLLPSKMVINVTSTDPLQVSLSKTCLEVLNNLAKAFNDAYNLVPVDKKKEEVLSPYLFQNHTGYEILLKLDNSFEPPESCVQGKTKLAVEASLPVYNKTNTVSAKTKGSQIKATQEGEERKIIFQVEQFQATREVTVKRAEKRLFEINQKSHQGDTWALVCNTDCTIGQKLVSLQSVVTVKSELTFPVEVQYKGDRQIETCGVVHPDQSFSLPLNAVYGISNDIFFKPLGESYTTSKTSINWRSAESAGLQEICCPSTLAGHSACYFSVFPELEHIFYESGDEKTGKSHILTLAPSVILHNLLPLTVNYMLEGTNEQETLEQGQNRPLMHASFNDANLEIVIPSYQGKEWVGRRKLQKNMAELTIWELTAYQGSQKVTMELGLHCKVEKGSLDISLYAPYWLLNKTGRTLFYRGSDQDTPIEHPPEDNQLILFSFKGKSFFGGKKKAQLRIDTLEWSDKFSLDTVGSSGTVQCKSKGKDAQNVEVGVSIQLSSSGLTKIATFTPFYMFLNTALDSIMVTESDKEEWVTIEPGQCLPFWPQSSGKDVKVKAKVKGTPEVTGDFLINKAHTTLLKLDNEYGGINADCQVSESSMITTLRTYCAGLATVIVINHTHNATLTFHQSGEDGVVTLNAQEAVTYTWDNALGKRELVWSCGKKKETKNDLIQDGMDEFLMDDDTKIYWVSFLDGMQRMLLFSEDLAIAANAQEAGELEQVEQEINLQIQGFGLSLVNNYNNTEVAFLGITSSGIIWEERKKRRYKALKLKECHLLEAAWQKYQNELMIGKNAQSRVVLDNKMEVDFADMTVIKPRTFDIRRSFQTGIWVQYKTSPHQLQLHAKLNRLQLDNQLNLAVFPTVLSPLPPPKSVAADSVPKPFTEVSMMMRKHEHSSVSQIKYFKVLIQEMNLKVDQGFLNAILELFAANEPLPREQETIQLKQDVASTEKSLMDVAGLSLAEEQKNFYDYLHFSPIKVHLSFSLQTGTGSSDGGKPVEIQAGVISVFLQSVGVVLTDVQDVVFKLGYFERSHSFYNQSQLTGEMTRHYAGQAIKQMYVLVLGLDVLGNPFGLLRGLSEGIEDLFYEPYQGAIQGPEEFAEGLALGVRSLFGHAVGGAAGAVSRITGTLGKGLATLTLDDDYQKKRREQMNKRPATAREGIARGGKGLVMGVFDGVTGIVRKPVEGAKQEGVSGFFKGMGKGLVGVVTRPTSGVIDFASSSFEGIRRIAEVSEDIKRLRPPRRFFKDGVIRPYNHQEAEGYAILQETEKGKYAVTDEYQAHVVVSKDGKSVLLVTDRRVLLAKRGEIFGSWDADWMYTWTELKEDTPKKTQKGIEIVLKEKEKKKFFSSSTSKKEIVIHDPKQAEWIMAQIQEQIARMRS